MFLRDIEVYWEGECTWLNRNQVIYVESTFDDSVNGMIQRRYNDICAIYQSQGLQFIYLPKLQDEVGQNVLQYAGAKRYMGSPRQAYMGIIPEQVLGHVYCPCLIHYIPEKRTFYIAIFQLKFNEDIFWTFLHCNAECYSLKCGAPFPDKRPENDAVPTPQKKPVSDGAKFSISTERMSREERDDKVRRSGGRSLIDVLGHDRDFGNLYTEEESDEERYSLSEPSADELALMADEENVRMIQQTANILNQLESRGISRELVLRLMKNAQQPKILNIDNECFYFQEDILQKRMVKLGPMERAFYILLLLHPEGIDYKQLVDYRKELLKIYRSLGARGNRKSQEETITNFCNPTKNMPSISASRIKRAFLALLREDIADQYLVKGPVGEKKYIPLDRGLVRWKDATLRELLNIQNERGEHRETTLQALARKIFGRK